MIKLLKIALIVVIVTSCRGSKEQARYFDDGIYRLYDAGHQPVANCDTFAADTLRYQNGTSMMDTSYYNDYVLNYDKDVRIGNETVNRHYRFIPSPNRAINYPEFGVVDQPWNDGYYVSGMNSCVIGNSLMGISWGNIFDTTYNSCAPNLLSDSNSIASKYVFVPRFHRLSGHNIKPDESVNTNNTARGIASWLEKIGITDTKIQIVSGKMNRVTGTVSPETITTPRGVRPQVRFGLRYSLSLIHI